SGDLTQIATYYYTTNRQSDMLSLNAADLSTKTTLPGIDGGVLFDQSQDLFYGVNNATDQIVAYDTNTWTPKWQMSTGESLINNTIRGHMSLSQDGNWLFLNSLFGVRAYDLRPAPS